MNRQPLFSLENASLTVSAVNLQIRSLLESDPILEDLWVKGELSNLSFPASGHIYFSIKDSKSSLKCVMWHSSVTQTALEVLKSGNAVELHGRVGVYEPQGVYQLYVDRIRKTGQGDLFEEFLRLKEKLEKEGLFAAERKQPIPPIPKTVGVVTSASGAALQDILNTLRKRWPIVRVILSPAAVQGVEAPGELTQALSRLIAVKPDVILIGRGGGSMEDLWAFNDEALVRMVAESPVPIISGVGHEVDFTLTDFAADLRAPTPTGAAVLAVPDREDVLIGLDEISRRMGTACTAHLITKKTSFEGIAHRLQMQMPAEKIRQERKVLEQLAIRLNQQEQNYLTGWKQLVSNLSTRLLSVSPEAVMNRGYAVVLKESRVVVKAAALKPADQIRIRFSDGEQQAVISESAAQKE